MRLDIQLCWLADCVECSTLLAFLRRVHHLIAGLLGHVAMGQGSSERKPRGRLEWSTAPRKCLIRRIRVQQSTFCKEAVR